MATQPLIRSISTLGALALFGVTLACGDLREATPQSQRATSCSECHGDRTVAALPGDPASAPPNDVEGRSESDPSATAIGAHQDHLVAGVLGAAVACDECHVVPTSLISPGHLDNQVKVSFGALAAKNGLAPSYDPLTQTCSNVYCHGNFNLSKKPPSLPPAPTWRGGEAAVACGSCHDLPPPVPTHVDLQGISGCNGNPRFPALACHPAPGAGKPGYSFDPTTGIGTVDPKLHIDGRICPPSCTPEER
jgi:predicted CxxxxCH...CXXCH cytochrome family protein